MIAIETEYGRFEADTEKEAMRLARTAKRKAANQKKRDMADREEAHRNACQNGYRVLCYLADRNRGYHRWRVYSPEQELFPASKMDELGIYRLYQTQTEWGTFDLPVYQAHNAKWDTLEGVLRNNAGFIIAVWIRTSCRKIRCFAVGMHNHEGALTDLPNVKMSAFAASKLEVIA